MVVAGVGPDVAEAILEAQAALDGSSQIGIVIQSAVDSLVLVSPEPIKSIVSTLGGDVASLAMLTPTAPGLARLLVRHCL